MTTRTAASAASAFYDLSAQTLDGRTLNFGDLRGKVVIVTNVASR
jgi:glutathione peroxidase-family protein